MIFLTVLIFWTDFASNLISLSGFQFFVLVQKIKTVQKIKLQSELRVGPKKSIVLYVDSLFEDLCHFQFLQLSQTEQMKVINKNSIKTLIQSVAKKLPEKLADLRKIFTKIYQDTMESSIVYSQIGHLLSVFTENFEFLMADCVPDNQNSPENFVETGFIEMLFRILKKLITNLESSNMNINSLSNLAPNGQFPQNSAMQMQTVLHVSEINQRFEYRHIASKCLAKILEGYRTKKLILYSGQIQLLLDFIVKLFVQVKVLINPGLNKFGLNPSPLEKALLNLGKSWVDEFGRGNGNFFCWSTCSTKVRNDVQLVKLTDTLQVFGVLFGFYIANSIKLPKNDQFFWELIDLRYSCETEITDQTKKLVEKSSKDDKNAEQDSEKKEGTAGGLNTVNVNYVNYIHILSKILPVYLYDSNDSHEPSKIQSYIVNSVISLDENTTQNLDKSMNDDNSEKLDKTGDEKSEKDEKSKDKDNNSQESFSMENEDNSRNNMSSGITEGSLEEIVSNLTKNLITFSCFRAYLLSNLNIFDKEDNFYPALIKYSIKLTREHCGNGSSYSSNFSNFHNSSQNYGQNSSFGPSDSKVHPKQSSQNAQNPNPTNPAETVQKFNQIQIQRLITKVLTICLEILCVKIGNISQHKKSILSQIMLIVSDKTASNQVLFTILKMLNAWVIQRTPGAEIGFDTDVKRKEEIQEHLVKYLELPSLVTITPQARGHQEQCPVSIRELAHHFCKVSTHIERLVNRTNIGTNPNLKGEGVGELKGFSELKNDGTGKNVGVNASGFNIYGTSPFSPMNQSFFNESRKKSKTQSSRSKNSNYQNSNSQKLVNSPKNIQKLGFGMFRSMQFEYDFVEQESLKCLISDLAKLVASVYKDEGLAGTEITTRLESAFNMSICVVTGKLHIEDPALFSIKNDLIKTLTTHVKRKPSDRLAYIFASHNWEFMGQRYWIPHCIDMILGCLEPGNHFIPPEITLDDDGKDLLPKELRKADEYINGLINKLTLSKLLPGIVSLCYISKELSHRFWLRFFPSVWKSCGVKGRASINKSIGQFLVSGAHMSQLKQTVTLDCGETSEKKQYYKSFFEFRPDQYKNTDLWVRAGEQTL